jgi:hypothetical protein
MAATVLALLVGVTLLSVLRVVLPIQRAPTSRIAGDFWHRVIVPPEVGGVWSAAPATPAPASIYMTANPLRDLQPLQKYHHAWPPDPMYYNSSSPTFIQGLMHDYVRITGSCDVALDAQPGVLRAQVEVCIRICVAVAPNRSLSAPPVLSVQWSPWFHKFSGSDPTVRGDAEAADLAMYGSLLANLSAWLKGSPVRLGAVLLDSEKFSYNENSSDLYLHELTRKHDLVYNTTRVHFPDPSTRLEMYDRGGMEPCALSSVPVHPQRCFARAEMAAADNPDGQLVVGEKYVSVNSYTLRERGGSYGAVLYQLQEIWMMRGRQAAAVVAAEAHSESQSGESISSVTPWIALGAGYYREAVLPKPGVGYGGFSFSLNYDAVYSWQMGREVNGLDAAWDERWADGFAPWDAAKVAVLFPGVFDSRSDIVPIGCASCVGHGNSSVSMQHFVNYVRVSFLEDPTATLVHARASLRHNHEYAV